MNAGWKHWALISLLFVLAAASLFLGIVWPLVSGVSPPIAHYVIIVAMSPVSWFVVVMAALMVSLLPARRTVRHGLLNNRAPKVIQFTRSTFVAPKQPNFDTSANMDCELDKWNVDFGVAKSIRYHSYRRSFWDSANCASRIAIAVSGSAVLMSLIGNNHPLAEIFAIIVAMISIGDIVFQFSKRARDHDSLYRRFSILAQEISGSLTATEQDISTWRRRRLEIEMDEPGIIDMLERRCWIEEAISRGCEIKCE